MIRTLLTPTALPDPRSTRTTNQPRLPVPLALAGAAAMAGAALALFLAERRWPLRARREPGGRRVARNLTLGAMSMAVVALVQTPLTQPLAARAERRRRGLAQCAQLPAWGRDALAFLLMDYTIYLWHRATHRNAFLWRFHLVHHLDLDLDTTTALRFHAADMALSVPYRCLQVALIGTSPRALRLWQSWFFLSVLFHHSNLRLPAGLETGLARLLTTPRMHGIHHKAAREESDSNWSSGLSIWDHLHGTFRFHEHQSVPIGVPAYQLPGDVRLGRSLALPFSHQADAWAPRQIQTKLATAAHRH